MGTKNWSQQIPIFEGFFTFRRLRFVSCPPCWANDITCTQQIGTHRLTKEPWQFQEWRRNIGRKGKSCKRSSDLHYGRTSPRNQGRRYLVGTIDPAGTHISIFYWRVHRGSHALIGVFCSTWKVQTSPPLRCLCSNKDQILAFFSQDKLWYHLKVTKTVYCLKATFSPDPCAFRQFPELMAGETW